MTDAARRAQELVRVAAVGDPSIDPSAAELIARECLALLHEEPQLDAPELARRVVADHPEADASWVNYLARAAVAGA